MIRNNIEGIVIGREDSIRLIYRMLARVGDRRVTKDCKAHLKEMKRDPSYVPENLTIAKMIGR